MESVVPAGGQYEAPHLAKNAANYTALTPLVLLRRAAWTYLKRLWRFGLLERSRLSGTLKYKISERGMARLRWLR